MSTPSGDNSTEQQALSNVHKFFDEWEMKAKAFLGTMSTDAKELFAKLRGQVHTDVSQASEQAKEDIAEGETDVSEVVTGMNHQPAAGQVPSSLRTPDDQPAQGTGLGQPLKQDPGTPTAG